MKEKIRKRRRRKKCERKHCRNGKKERRHVINFISIIKCAFVCALFYPFVLSLSAVHAEAAVVYSKRIIFYHKMQIEMMFSTIITYFSYIVVLLMLS
jgi:hypothetical protein